MKGIIKQVLLATCLIGAPTSVYALPFQPNPQSFQNYMNTIKWDDGSKITFQNLNNCRIVSIDGDGGYVCSSGFSTISNPMGTRVCSLDFVAYDPATRRSNFNKTSCRYK